MNDKIEQFWRDATADDVARVMRGETVEARFSDGESEDLGYGFLSGWVKWDNSDDIVWASSIGDYFTFCQVYDPPEWYINKPDPGEGFRLLEKFPPEEPQEGDQVKHYEEPDKAWVTLVRGFDPGQRDWVWYRRRIETNSPTSSDSSTAENTSEAPYGSRSRNTIPRGWRLLGKDEERLASDAHWSQSCKEWLLIGDDRVKYANELPRWRTIRQTTNMTELSLIEGFGYVLPGGGRIRVTAKGFEVLQ